MLKQNINLLVKLILLIMLVCIIAVVVLIPDHDMRQEDTSVVNNTVTIVSRDTLNKLPILFPELDYMLSYNTDSTKELLSKLRSSITELENVNSADYTKKAVRAMSKELCRLQEIEVKVASDLEHYLTWEKDYYYATKVWQYFRQCGFNNVVTCAIIGNMMIETSDGTLDLNPTIYSPSSNYYGLCQWSQKYYPETKDLPFEAQLDYLLESIPLEFNSFGKNYKSGFNYEDFIKMTDIEEATLAFAKSYERCSSVSYEMRQEAALKAYEYFNLD